jgi:hypothetical protein
MIGMTIGMAMSGWWPGAFGMAIAAGTYCGRFCQIPVAPLMACIKNGSIWAALMQP